MRVRFSPRAQNNENNAEHWATIFLQQMERIEPRRREADSEAKGGASRRAVAEARLYFESGANQNTYEW